MFNTIRQQEVGWTNTIYGFRFDEETVRFRYTKDFMSEINNDNYREQIPLLINVIIHRYTENLKVFRYLLNSFVQLCYRYDEIKSQTLIYCSNKLRETVMISTKMLLKFLYVALFIHNANLLLDDHCLLNHNKFYEIMVLLYRALLKKPSIINDMFLAHRLLKSTRNYIKDTMDKKIVELVNSNMSTIYIYDHSVQNHIQRILNMKNVIFSKSIDDHTRALNWFYMLAVRDSYYNLGFDKVLVGDIKDCEDEYSQASICQLGKIR
ncbi:uncharacterized protein LOC126896775 isoform X2 [Daktulosphaira vitifoliae]|uniref:uncharacterized protein LOC126896775 isoform X2 n=1 Tax=Daktulosphaira vitifoliae TaxID=58002 RepID=UPI0021AA7158|nr:uncharacterized protein LOC126896775 isoform X2 [Daktulosphaira vitifoliae]